MLFLITAAACEQNPSSLLAPDEAVFVHGKSNGNPATYHQQLAALRALTAPYHNLDKAVDAGYTTDITGCLEHPTEGGMGHHYANFSYIDGTVNLLEPELLVYEPQKNGRLRLVAIEYIVPYVFASREGPAPTLMGQSFHPVDDAGIWGLHVWLWRNNPSGMHADWNPRVSCRYAR